MLKSKKDAYTVSGIGFDSTYDFEFPMRIDFILVDNRLKINYFKRYKEKYSDHFPIMARIDKSSFEGLGTVKK
jgi:endonuclease/exonuclease/phosphatase family metal-dependent hydrolase